MRTSTTSDQLQASDLPARAPCAVCEHPEFVHGDSEPNCLYTECDCIRFTSRYQRLTGFEVARVPTASTVDLG